MSYEELLEGRRALQAWKRDRRLKSFYPRPIPNYTAISDVERTLIHETEGLLLDFTDEHYKSTTGLRGLALVKDRAVLANNFNGPPFELVTYSGDSKLLRGPNGLLYENDPEVDLPYEWDEDGNLLGIRIEEQRTNSRTYSQQFDNAAWSKDRVTATVAEELAPDGQSASYLLQGTGDTGDSNIGQNYTSSAGVAFTSSVFAKAGTAGFLVLHASSSHVGSTKRTWFNLTNGTIGEDASDNATIEPYGNGWYRCSVTHTATLADTSLTRIYLAETNGSLTDGSQKNIYIWGAQLEVGAFPTSYIPTTSETVTRTVDSISLALSAIPYNANAVTLEVEWSRFAELDLLNAPRVWELHNGSTAGGMRLFGGSTADRFQIGTGVDASSDAPVLADTVVLDATTWGLSSSAVWYRDHNSVVVDSEYTIPTVSILSIGNRHGGDRPLNGHIKSFILFPRYSSASELQPDFGFSNIWTGGLTDDGITISADALTEDGYNVIVTKTADTGFITPVYTSEDLSPTAVDKSGGGSHYLVKHAVTGLEAGTDYRFALVRTGRAINQDFVGTFTTAPAEGVAASFSFAFGSCSEWDAYGSDISAAEGILADTPLFLLHLGDLSYDDYIGSDPAKKRSMFTRLYLSYEKAQNLHKAVPIVYTWSDHDSAANDMDRSDAGFDEAIAMNQGIYKESVPHYPLTVPGTLFQTFRIANCCFIIMDSLSLRSTVSGQETAIGTDQFNAVVAAAQEAVADGCSLIFLADGMTWIGRSGPDWSDWRTEQTALLDALRAISGLPKVIVLNGDCHAMGADDGTNCDYSTAGGMDIQNFQCAPMLNQVNTTGGPHSWNAVDTKVASYSRAYGIVSVDALNQHVTVTFKGSTSGLPETVATYDTADL